MIAGDACTPAGVKDPLRRPAAVLDSRLLRQLTHGNPRSPKEYGASALVLGLIGFLYLAAQVTLYASEINVVRARHLWPRGLVQPPLTPADKEVLSSIALEGQRRPEQYVATGFQADGTAGEGRHGAP
jgi:hypothetical protein